MLFDFGKAAQAVPYYEKSVKYAPESGLIRMAYAQALIESSEKDPLRLKDAIGQLKRAERDEPRVSKIKDYWRPPLVKWAKSQRLRIYLAEEALMQGNKK